MKSIERKEILNRRKLRKSKITEDHFWHNDRNSFYEQPEDAYAKSYPDFNRRSK